MRYEIRFNDEVIGKVMTNHSMTKDEMCDLAGVKLAFTEEDYMGIPENGMYDPEEIEIVEKKEEKPMRKHFIVKNTNFANSYSLAWTASKDELKKAIQDGWEQITRKQAIALCVEERRRRRTDYAFSGFADVDIFPLDRTEREREMFNVRAAGFVSADGYVYVRE